MGASRAWMMGLVAALGVGGCVDVPEPVTPVDARADRGPDGAPDARVDDGAPADDARIDGAPADGGPLDGDRPDGPRDAAPDRFVDDDPDAGPAVAECLEPLDGPGGEDGACLQVIALEPLPEARIQAAGGVVTLPDGRPRLVVAGGYDRYAAAVQADERTWIFDPSTGAWSPGPALDEARWGAAAAVDGEGALVIAGGAPLIDGDGEWVGLASSERFDGGRWQRNPRPLEPGRARAAAAPLQQQRVLVAGGQVRPGQAPVADSDVLTPDGALSQPGSLRRARSDAALAPLPDGRLLLVGGRQANGGPETIAEIVRADGARFDAVSGTLFGGIGAAAAPLSDGALVIGGATAAAPDGGREAWRMRVEPTIRVEPLPALHTPRMHATVSPIGPPDGDWRLVVGGDDAGVVELYDPVADRLVAYPLPLPFDHGRRHHVAGALRVGDSLEVVVVGGVRWPAGDGAPITDVLRFRLTPPPPPIDDPLPAGCLVVDGVDPDDGPCVRVRRGPALPRPLADLAAAAAPDGRIAISGGRDPGLEADKRASAESAILYLGGRVWRAGPDMATARWGHVMTMAASWNAPAIYVYGGAVDDPDDGLYSATDLCERLPAAQPVWQPLDGQLTAPWVDGAVGGFGSSGARWLLGGWSRAEGDAHNGGDFVNFAQVVPFVDPMLRARIHAAACPTNNTLVIFGGHDGAALVETAEVHRSGEDWRQIDVALQARTGAACLGLTGRVDIFGGRSAVGGPATADWQRLDIDENGEQARPLGSLGRARWRPTVTAIGTGEFDAAAWLVVGGEDAGDDLPAAVDLIFPNLPDGARRQYTVRLPEGVGRRRGHAAVSRRVQPDVGVDVIDQEAVVLGGFGADGAALDEVLIFTLDPFDPPGGFGPDGPGDPDGMQ